MYLVLSPTTQQESMDISNMVTLNSFNYYEWKAKIEILLCRKGIYGVTMALEIDPNALDEKERLHNRKDEAYVFLCLSLSGTSFPY